MSNNEKGFTLIELLVVVAIIGILAAVGVVAYNGYTTSAKKSAATANHKNVVILAHNYQTPEIYHGIADFSADSLALAVEASKTSADIIVMAGVHFMAETAKLMSPNKKVLLPDMKAELNPPSNVMAVSVVLCFTNDKPEFK